MNINKLLHSPNVAGQSLVDRVTAAKHSLAGERLAKFVCKATTEEQIPPKKKHIDRKFGNFLGKSSESVQCAITGPCLRMRQGPSA